MYVLQGALEHQEALVGLEPWDRVVPQDNLEGQDLWVCIKWKDIAINEYYSG